MATTVVSMAARSSNLEDRMSGANLQTEGHADVPSQSPKDPEEIGASGKFPFPLTILVPSQEATAQPS